MSAIRQYIAAPIQDKTRTFCIVGETGAGKTALLANCARMVCLRIRVDQLCMFLTSIFRARSGIARFCFTRLRPVQRQVVWSKSIKYFGCAFLSLLYSELMTLLRRIVLEFGETLHLQQVC